MEMIGFAHRGAPSAGVRENTLAAFTHALQQGATALESDVWLTADAVPVLVHDGFIRLGLRRRAIGEIPASALPGWLPSLAALYESTDTPFDLSLDIKDPEAGAAVAEVARSHHADERLWMCGTVAQVNEWRTLATQAHPVVSTTLRTGRQIFEHRIEEAAEVGAAALNLRSSQWSAPHVQRCHDLGMLAFAWDVQQRSTLASMKEFGCDAIFSDSLTVLAAARDDA
jgi:glycerophosphoryl diester phosphodiesterase